MTALQAKLANTIRRSIRQWHKNKRQQDFGSLNDYLLLSDAEMNRFEADEQLPVHIIELYDGYRVPENLPVIPPTIIKDLIFMRDFEQCRSARYLVRIIIDLGWHSTCCKRIRRWIEEDHLRIASVIWYYKETRGEQ